MKIFIYDHYLKKKKSPSSICIKELTKHGMFDKIKQRLWFMVKNRKWFQDKKINQYLTNYFYRSENIIPTPYYKKIKNLIIIIFEIEKSFKFWYHKKLTQFLFQRMFK